MYTIDLQTMSLILLDFAAPARDQPFAPIEERVVMEITPPAPSPTPPTEVAHSSAREKVLEHLFVGELLRCLWRRGIRNMEVLRAEVDMGGYDLVLEANKVLRYVQLKSSHRTSATANVPVNVNLEGKPGGCVVWMKFDPETVELGPYLWFGAKPGEPALSLGSKIARHSKGDKCCQSGASIGSAASTRLSTLSSEAPAQPRRASVSDTLAILKKARTVQLNRRSVALLLVVAMTFCGPAPAVAAQDYVIRDSHGNRTGTTDRQGPDCYILGILSGSDGHDRPGHRRAAGHSHQRWDGHD